MWDWIDHDTGKTCKLDKTAISQMQMMLADCFGMERGTAKSLTGAKHLERNDFIKAKQEDVIAYNQSVITNQQREIDAKEAIIAEKQSEADKEAVSFLGTKAQSWFGMGELAELRNKVMVLENEVPNRLTELEKSFDKRVNDEVQERMRPMANQVNQLLKVIGDKDNVLLDEKAKYQALSERHSKAVKGIEWRNSALTMVGSWLCEYWEMFSEAVKKLISFAKENARLGFYRNALDAEEAKAVKNVMDAFSQEPSDRNAIGNLLVMTASNQDEAVEQQEYILYQEMKSIANGGYDRTIRNPHSYRF